MKNLAIIVQFHFETVKSFIEKKNDELNKTRKLEKMAMNLGI